MAMLNNQRVNQWESSVSDGPSSSPRSPAEAPGVPSGASELTDALWQAIAEAWHRGGYGKDPPFLMGKSPFLMGKIHNF